MKRHLYLDIGSAVMYCGRWFRVLQFLEGDRIYIGIPGHHFPQYFAPFGYSSYLERSHHDVSVHDPFLFVPKPV